MPGPILIEKVGVKEVTAPAQALLQCCPNAQLQEWLLTSETFDEATRWATEHSDVIDKSSAVSRRKLCCRLKARATLDSHQLGKQAGVLRAAREIRGKSGYSTVLRLLIHRFDRKLLAGVGRQ